MDNPYFYSAKAMFYWEQTFSAIIKNRKSKHEHIRPMLLIYRNIYTHQNYSATFTKTETVSPSTLLLVKQNKKVAIENWISKVKWALMPHQDFYRKTEYKENAKNCKTIVLKLFVTLEKMFFINDRSTSSTGLQ